MTEPAILLTVTNVFTALICITLTSLYWLNQIIKDCDKRIAQHKEQQERLNEIIKLAKELR